MPWPQKGASVSLPLGTSAPVWSGAENAGASIVKPAMVFRRSDTGAWPVAGVAGVNAAGAMQTGTGALASPLSIYPSNLYADLSSSTAATINAIRTAFQIQRLLERDARGGTRYTELVLSHFGARSPDMRLQRPEYIGGGSTPMLS